MDRSLSVGMYAISIQAPRGNGQYSSRIIHWQSAPRSYAQVAYWVHGTRCSVRRTHLDHWYRHNTCVTTASTLAPRVHKGQDTPAGGYGRVHSTTLTGAGVVTKQTSVECGGAVYRFRHGHHKGTQPSYFCGWTESKRISRHDNAASVHSSFAERPHVSKLLARKKQWYLLHPVHRTAYRRCLG